jgi:hypothetical protein
MQTTGRFASSDGIVGGTSVRRLFVLSAFLLIALASAVLPSPRESDAQDGCFAETGDSA